MKRLLLLIALAVVGYFGYQYYRGSRSLALPPAISDHMNITQKGGKVDELMNVLGATTSNLYNQSKTLLNNATNGTAEPVVNKVVGDLQDRVKQLPEEEYKKVKYEFCKDVFPSPNPTL